MHLIGHLGLIAIWLGVDLRTDNNKNVFERDSTTCSNMLTILGSIFNINWKDLYDHLMNTGTFTLIMNKIFIWAPKLMNKSLQASFGFASHLTLIACFISNKKWVQRENCPNNTSRLFDQHALWFPSEKACCNHDLKNHQGANPSLQLPVPDVNHGGDFFF